MTYKASLFFNFPELRDTLILVIDEKEIPDRSLVKGDIVGLYKGERLVGINVFNANSYLKLRLSGLIHNPNEPLIKLVRTIIKNALGEDVVLEESPVYLGKVTSFIDGSYEVELEEGKKAKAGVYESSEQIKDGTYVLLTPSWARLDNGQKADEYLKGGQAFLIVGEEDEGLEEGELGEEAYSLKS